MIAGHQVRAIRLTFVGELGWELHVPNDAAVDIYQAVMQEGAKHGVTNGGYRALDSLSLEKGEIFLFFKLILKLSGEMHWIKIGLKILYLVILRVMS